jgi:hypothetical protein
MKLIITIGGGNDAVVASLLGKALIPFLDSEIIGSKLTPLIKTHLLP